VGEYAAPGEAVDAKGVRVGVAVARFNEDVTGELLAGARRILAKHGVADDDVTTVWVPGAFELPLVADRLARSRTVDAVVCIGAVIRGDTPHFEYVAGEAARGIMATSLHTGVPVIFGVLTTDDRAQADARIGGVCGHKGEEAALTALEMVALLRQLPEPRD
jgi:6,7-dimethyl-8-ribityllumazine synthase